MASFTGSRLGGVDPAQVSTMCGCIERLMHMFAGEKHPIVNRLEEQLA